MLLSSTSFTDPDIAWENDGLQRQSTAYQQPGSHAAQMNIRQLEKFLAVKSARDNTFTACD